MELTEEQQRLVVKAGLLIKEAFPQRNMQFNFNLSKSHDNINYNMEGSWKLSGIIPVRKHERHQ